jgi:hypothetical protein
MVLITSVALAAVSRLMYLCAWFKYMVAAKAAADKHNPETNKIFLLEKSDMASS